MCHIFFKQHAGTSIRKKINEHLGIKKQKLFCPDEPSVQNVLGGIRQSKCFTWQQKVQPLKFSLTHNACFFCFLWRSSAIWRISLEIPAKKLLFFNSMRAQTELILSQCAKFIHMHSTISLFEQHAKLLHQRVFCQSSKCCGLSVFYVSSISLMLIAGLFFNCCKGFQVGLSLGMGTASTVSVPEEVFIHHSKLSVLLEWNGFHFRCFRYPQWPFQLFFCAETH